MDTEAKVWNVPLPNSAFLWVLNLNSVDLDLEEQLASSDESSAHKTGTTFDLPCLVSWLGSCITKADALPYV